MRYSYAKIIFRGLFCLIFPVCEFLLLRYWLHFFLGLRIGWGNLMVDTDLFIPGVFAYLVFFFCRYEKKAFGLELKKRVVVFNGISLGIFIGLNLFYQPLSHSFGLAFTVLWWTVALLTLGSAFFFWVSFKTFFSKPSRELILPCALMAVSTLLCKHFFDNLWVKIAKGVVSEVCPHLKHVLSETVRCDITNRESGESVLIMFTKSFRASVGRPCSGVDGMILFFNLSILVWIGMREKLSIYYWSTSVVVGALLMMLLNVFRISLLFVTVVFLHKTWPNGKGLSFFNTYVHSNLGWVMYLLFGIGYFSGTRKFWEILFRIKNPIYPRLFLGFGRGKSS